MLHLLSHLCCQFLFFPYIIQNQNNWWVKSCWLPLYLPSLPKFDHSKIFYVVSRHPTDPTEALTCYQQGSAINRDLDSILFVTNCLIFQLDGGKWNTTHTTNYQEMHLMCNSEEWISIKGLFRSWSIPTQQRCQLLFIGNAHK